MIYLYYHGGSANHGCEAIVRSTAKILDMPLSLFSTAVDEEYRYHIDELVSIQEDRYIPVPKTSLRYIGCALDHKFNHHDYLFIKYGHQDFFNKIKPGDVCLSIGGDNYCYDGIEKLDFYNRIIHKKGAKTVLWGCSIEPKSLTNALIKDLMNYDLITVRESLSYEGLANAGIKDNVVLCSDPAFQLDMTEMSLPEGFNKQNTVGINVSPLVMDKGNLVLENYISLIHYILSETDLRVLLIPHVVKEESDDRNALQMLAESFPLNDKIALIPDCNCQQLKGVIAQCRFFVGARTHATIAAYSSCIPTLVAGYSVKAKGIAKDIFGDFNNYVISVQSFSHNQELKNNFMWLMEHEEEICTYLKKQMPNYCAKSLIAKEYLQKII